MVYIDLKFTIYVDFYKEIPAFEKSLSIIWRSQKYHILPGYFPIFGYFDVLLPGIYLSLLGGTEGMIFSSLFAGANTADSDDSNKVSNWSDKIMDESNNWLRAVMKEEENEFERAAELYLRDATDNKRLGLLNRSALSCTCAAICVSKYGDRAIAQRLFFEAGTLYDMKSKTTLSSSIRESIWAATQAYENFIMSGDLNKAEEIYEDIIHYMRRVDPLSNPQDLKNIHGTNIMKLSNMKFDLREKATGPDTDSKLNRILNEFLDTSPQK